MGTRRTDLGDRDIQNMIRGQGDLGQARELGCLGYVWGQREPGHVCGREIYNKPEDRDI